MSFYFLGKFKGSIRNTIQQSVTHYVSFNITKTNVRITGRKEPGKRALLTPGNDTRSHPGTRGVSQTLVFHVNGKRTKTGTPGQSARPQHVCEQPFKPRRCPDVSGEVKALYEQLAK